MPTSEGLLGYSTLVSVECMLTRNVVRKEIVTVPLASVLVTKDTPEEDAVANLVQARVPKIAVDTDVAFTTTK